MKPSHPDLSQSFPFGAQMDVRLELLVSSVRDYAIFLLDTDGRIQSWNRGAQAIKGYDAREIIGHHIETFYTAEDRLIGKPERLLRIAREEGRVEDEGWRVRKDGTRFWADVVLTALRDQTGALVGYAKVTRDLTERRAAEEALRQSEARLRLLVESVRDYAIFMLDPDGRVATWNIGAERIKGWNADEIIGQHFALFYPDASDAAERAARSLAIAMRDGRFEEQGWRRRKDGSQFWADVLITPMRDSTGQFIGYVKVTRDLTDQRRAEEERMRLMQAQEAVRLRDEFLSIASHELRTPLTALQLQLDVLRRPSENLDERIGQRVDRAWRSAERLAQLIDSLLDVSRIATGHMEVKRAATDLGELVRDTVDRLRETAERVGCEVRLRLDGPLPGTWDRLRVSQVITNLLANAFKYGAGKPIDVEAGRERDEAVVRVSDRGPGIAEKDRARIFERFERAASMRNYGGMGLGLYVAREIVQAHGGVIGVEDAPGGGACFVVRLPFTG